MFNMKKLEALTQKEILKKYKELHKKYVNLKSTHAILKKKTHGFNFSLFNKYFNNQRTSTKSVDFLEHYHKNHTHEINKLSYLAGLIDGEGCLKIEKWGTIRLIIGMTHKKTIYWIKNNFGGNVKKQKTPKGGPFYVWRMNQGKDLFYLLMLVSPFMITKRKILEDALETMLKRVKQCYFTLPRRMEYK